MLTALGAWWLLMPSLGLAQQVRSPRISTNSTVYSVIRTGDTTILGGSFSQGGYYSTNIAMVTPGNDFPDFDFPLSNGTIQVVISDSAGGWYVGGSFSKIGTESRRYLAHILPDMSVDANFDPNPNSTVYALVLKGQKLYVGGSFTQIGGEAVKYVCELDLQQGAIPTQWRPEPSSSVYALNLSSSNSVFVGGSFSTIAGKNQRNFAEIRLDQDTLVPNVSTNSTVNSIQSSGNDVYVGGNFSETGHYAQYGAITTRENDFPFNHFPGFNGSIEVIVNDGNGGWYIGGAFSQVNGESYPRLVHILSDYSIDPSFNLTPNSTVYDIALGQGGVMYVSGSFTQIFGQTRGYAAKIDLANGNTLMNWDPQVNSAVYSVTTMGTTDVYLGGSFTKIAGKTQRYFARVTADNATHIHTVSVNSTLQTLAYSPTAGGGSGYVYAGGSFSESGYYAPYGGFLPTGDVPSLDFPDFNGAIEVTIPDGNGGWYIGGSFSQVGGQSYPRLVHILSDLSIDPSFLPTPNSTVYDLALSGGTLYVGGSFTSIGGQTSGYIGAISATTGVMVSGWAANPAAANSTVYAVALDGSTLYFGGGFTTIAGTARNRMAAVDASNGTLLSFDPNLNSTVQEIEVGASGLWAGGSFSMVGGQTRSNIAQLDKTTGAAVLGFNATCNSTVYSIELSGSFLNVGGSFTQIGGQPRGYLAQLNVANGTATVFNVSANAAVYFYKNGYVGGTFTSLGGQTRNYAGRIVANALDSWNPQVNSYVNTLMAGGGANGLLVGGSFTYFRYRSTPYVGAFNPATNQFSDTWTGKANSTVYDIQIMDNSYLYIGGTFSQINNVQRNYAAEMGVQDPGTLSTWNPNLNAAVYDIYGVADSVYLGGTFTQVGNQPRNYAALVRNTNHQTSTLLGWNPQLNSYCNSITASSNLIALGGSFTYFKYTPRNYLLGLDNATALPYSWNPNVNSTVQVVKILDGKLYVGGNFSQVNGNPRNGLVRYTLATGAVNTFEASWNARTPSGFTVYDIAKLDTTVYAVGYFDGLTVQNQKRKHAAAFGYTKADLVAWQPQMDGQGNSLATYNGKIVVGGSFSFLKSETRSNLLAIDETTGLILDWAPNPNSTVYVLKQVGSTLYVGGSFTNIRNSTRNYLASIDLTTGNLNPWNPSMNNAVYAIDASDSVVYVGGAFTTSKGQTRNYAAAFTFDNDFPQGWDPNPNNYVNAILYDGNQVYLGGNFNMVGNATRNRLAAVEKGNSGALNAFDPNLNGVVYSLAKNSTRLYVGGSFSSVGGTSDHRYAAAFKLSDGSITSWDPQLNSTVQSVAARDSLVFLGGGFTNAAGTTSNYATVVGAGYGFLLGGTFNLGSTVQVIADFDSLIYVGGSFTKAEENEHLRYNAVYSSVNITTTDIAPLQDAVSGIKAYPNPTSGILWLESESLEVVSYSVIALDGRVVRSGEFSSKTQLDLSRESTGMYLVRLRKGGQESSLKVVVGQ